MTSRMPVHETRGVVSSALLTERMGMYRFPDSDGVSTSDRDWAPYAALTAANRTGSDGVEESSRWAEYGDMNSPTREEIDAKLKASHAEMRGEFNTSFARIEGVMGQMSQTMAQMQAALADVRTDMRDARAEARTDSKETQRESRNTRLTVIISAVGTFIAIAAAMLAYDNNRIGWLNTGKAFGGDPVHAPPAPPTAAK